MEHVNIFSRWRFVLLLCGKTTALTWNVILFLLVDCACEGISEGNGSKEHFNAGNEVLPASCHCAGPDFMSIDDEGIGYDAAALEDGENHSYKAAVFFHQQLIFAYRYGAKIGGYYLPCQKDKKMTDLIVRNLSTGSYGLSRSLVAKKKRKSAYRARLTEKL